jgi:pyridine nucleotide-disulfide oxidoreductase family protein
MNKRMLLLGGGHAHVHVLQALARKPLAGVDVALVTPFARQMYSGMVPGLVAGHYTVDQCAIALQPLAEAAGVSMIEGSVVALDANARQATLSDGRVVDYDLLSLDTGAVMSRDRFPGAREHGLFVRPIEHFVRLFEGLLDLAAHRVLDVVVVGGGAAGVELALALAHRLSERRAKGEDERARVALVTGGGQPLEGYPLGVVQRAQQALTRGRVTVFRDSCAALEARLLVLGSGARLSCDAAVLATGAEAPRWLAGSGLALDERGFVLTGPTLQSQSHPDVLAAGDVASRVDRPHPKSGVYAVRAGPALATNLRHLALGEAAQPYEPPRRTLNLISCGERRAIVSWGDLAVQGRWAWWWKDRIDRQFVARYSRPTPPAGGVAVTRSA